MGNSNSARALRPGVLGQTIRLSIRLPLPLIVERPVIKRPEGYRLPNSQIVAVRMKFQDIDVTGHGEDQQIERAIAKAESEAIERYALFYAPILGIRSESSNGWACHMIEADAVTAAVSELVERNVAVTAWENFGPYLRVPRELWPEPVQCWDNSLSVEFPHLEVLQSVSDNGACITVLLLSDEGKCVTGHASGLDLKNSILSATQECMRTAQLALRFGHFADVRHLHGKTSTVDRVDPGIHGLAYAYQERLPREIKFEKSLATDIERNWLIHQTKLRRHIERAEVQLFEVGDRCVAFAKCPDIPVMRWGPTNTQCFTKNKLPHFVG